jgi:hypothetical protein
MKTFVIIFLSLFLIAISFAQVPQLVNYQGKLDSAGVPLNGTRDLTFKIYDVLTGGTAIWTETQTGATITNGVFNVILGSVSAFSTATSPLFTGTGDRYIGITVGSGTEMTPRLRITSVAYSLRASQADGVADNTITSAKIVDGTIVTADIAANAVGSSQIADGAVAAADLAANSVTTVKIADNNVTATKIADEPGIASNNYSGGIALNTASMIDLTTVTITTPSAGYIVLYGKCYVHFSGVTTQNTALVQIDETAGGSWTPPYYQYLGFDTYPTTATYRLPFNVMRIYYKSAGTYTFRLEGMEYNASPAAALVYYPMIHAIYYPTAYGTVVTSAGNESGDKNSQQISDPLR